MAFSPVPVKPPTAVGLAANGLIVAQSGGRIKLKSMVLGKKRDCDGSTWASMWGVVYDEGW